MIIISKFNIGQKVRHKLLGFLGIIIDIDSQYFLIKKNIKNFFINKTNKKSPLYYVIMEDNNGYPIHTYLSENQLSLEIKKKYIKNSLIYKLYKKIKKKIKKLKLKN